MGKIVQEGWKNVAEETDIEIGVEGIYPLGHFSFKYDKPLVLKTLYTQIMLEKGYLATTAYYASYAQSKDDVRKYLIATKDAFTKISDAIKAGNTEKLLKGPVCHSGFTRLT
jgi:hypothetical protein